MKKFSAKVREARRLLHLTQEELGKLTGVSKRAVVAYEKQDVLPRRNVKLKLAEVLRLSIDYLDKDEIEDPNYGLDKIEFVEEIHDCFGNQEAKEVEFLLERNTALFADGAIEQDDKDDFFAAVTKAYWAARWPAKSTIKEKPRQTYVRKKESLNSTKSDENIQVGKTYQNFRSHTRVVKDIFEIEGGRRKVAYEDYTGKYKTCEFNTFVQWVKKNYY